MDEGNKIRQAIVELEKMGKLPEDTNDDDISDDVIAKYESLLTSIIPPITDEEAKVLIKIMPDDSFYGSEWSILHLLETSPHWSKEIIELSDSEKWKQRMFNRLQSKNSEFITNG